MTHNPNTFPYAVVSWIFVALLTTCHCLDYELTYNRDKTSWREANAECRKDGGHLVDTSDIDVEMRLGELMKNNSQDELAIEDVWIGRYYTPWAWLKGCFLVENATAILESLDSMQSKTNQLKECVQYCRNTNYFGLKGNVCACIDDINTGEFTFAQTVFHCQTKCPGNEFERCGGSSSLTVYMNDLCWRNTSEWTGTVSMTISGRICQRWTSDTPHLHPYHADADYVDGSVDAADNYCRDPSHSGALWCYTTDPDVEWQFCDVPPCFDHCWTDVAKWTGRLNQTISGKTCLPWEEHKAASTSTFPQYPSASDGNYCREPSGKASPWCYYGSGINDREYCGVPPCFGHQAAQSTPSRCLAFKGVTGKIIAEADACQIHHEFACVFKTDHGRRVAKTRDMKRSWTKARDECRSNSAFTLTGVDGLFAFSTSFNSARWVGVSREIVSVTDQYKDVDPEVCLYAQLKRKGMIDADLESNCRADMRFVCQKYLPNCGEEIQSGTGNVSTLTFRHKSNDIRYCIWRVSIDQSETVNFTVSQMNIEESTNCTQSYLKISTESNGTETELYRVCGSEVPSPLLLRNVSFFLVIFRRDASDTTTGFTASWTTGTVLERENEASTMTPGGDDKGYKPFNAGDQSSGFSVVTTAGVAAGGTALLIAVVILLLVISKRRRSLAHKPPVSPERAHELQNLQRPVNNDKAAEEQESNSRPLVGNSDDVTRSCNSPEQQETYAYVSVDTKTAAEDVYSFDTADDGECYLHTDVDVTRVHASSGGPNDKDDDVYNRLNEPVTDDDRSGNVYSHVGQFDRGSTVYGHLNDPASDPGRTEGIYSHTGVFNDQSEQVYDTTATSRSRHVQVSETYSNVHYTRNTEQ